MKTQIIHRQVKVIRFVLLLKIYKPNIVFYILVFKNIFDKNLLERKFNFLPRSKRGEYSIKTSSKHGESCYERKQQKLAEIYKPNW